MKFRNKLIVSCQDNAPWTLEMAFSGMAAGFRVNGVEDTELAARYGIPVIACKKVKSGDKTLITPTIEDALSLIRAGATYVAFDCGQQDSTVWLCEMIHAIHDAGGLVVADTATSDFGETAWYNGADVVATTLWMYGNEKRNDIIKNLIRHRVCVMAEGDIRTPREAVESVSAGAELVCVGSAITRPHHVTRWFVDALEAMED